MFAKSIILPSNMAFRYMSAFALKTRGYTIRLLRGGLLVATLATLLLTIAIKPAFANSIYLPLITQEDSQPNNPPIVIHVDDGLKHCYTSFEHDCPSESFSFIVCVLPDAGCNQDESVIIYVKNGVNLSAKFKKIEMFEDGSGKIYIGDTVYGACILASGLCARGENLNVDVGNVGDGNFAFYFGLLNQDQNEG